MYRSKQTEILIWDQCTLFLCLGNKLKWILRGLQLGKLPPPTLIQRAFKLLRWDKHTIYSAPTFKQNLHGTGVPGAAWYCSNLIRLRLAVDVVSESSYVNSYRITTLNWGDERKNANANSSGVLWTDDSARGLRERNETRTQRKQKGCADTLFSSRRRPKVGVWRNTNQSRSQ